MAGDYTDVTTRGGYWQRKRGNEQNVQAAQGQRGKQLDVIRQATIDAINAAVKRGIPRGMFAPDEAINGYGLSALAEMKRRWSSGTGR